MAPGTLAGHGSWHLSSQLRRQVGAHTHYSGLLWLWGKFAKLALSSGLQLCTESLGFRGIVAETGILMQ